MDERIDSQKLSLLYGFAQLLPSDPTHMFVVGLLAGQISRVHFVKDLTGAPIAIRLVSSRARIWPTVAFSATVNAVDIPDPMTLGSVLSKSDDSICVELVHPGLSHNPETEHLFVESFVDIQAGRDETSQFQAKRTVELRSQIDQALDVYNECQRLMQAAGDDQARRQELETFLKLAKTNLAKCSRELKRLESEL